MSVKTADFESAALPSYAKLACWAATQPSEPEQRATALARIRIDAFCQFTPSRKSPQIGPIFGLFVKIQVEFRPKRQPDREVELPDGSFAQDLVRAVGESTDVIVAVRNKMPIPEDELLVDGETILLLSAASGG